MREEYVSAGKVKNAVVWSFSTELMAKIIVPITNMVLARILTPDAFGVIATINIIVSFADIFSTAGISRYIVQHEFSDEEELYQNADVAFWSNLLISLCIWVTIFSFSTPLTDFIGNPGYELPLIIAALSLPLTSLASIQEAIFQRKFNFKALFYRRLVVSIIPIFITIPLAICDYGFWALIIGTLVSNIFKILVLTFYSPWNPSFFYSVDIFREMFSFSAWMILVSVSSWFTYYIDIFIVSRNFNDFYTGLYCNSQTTVTGIISIFTSAISAVLFSTLSRFQSSREKFDYVLLSAQQNLSIFLIPLGVGIYVFSDLITNTLLGSQWMEASSFIGIWGLSTVIFCLFADFSKETFKAKGQPKFIFIVQIIHLLILLPVCYFSAKKGFYSIGVTRSLANIAIAMVYSIALWMIYKISLIKSFKYIKEPILASIFMGILGNVLVHINNDYILQLLYVIVCIIFYFYVLSLFGNYREKFKNILSNIKQKLIR